MREPNFKDGDLDALVPEVDWPKFREAVRAATWELFWGPLEEGYWTEVEPLEHYKWNGWMDALDYISEELNKIPTLYLDADFDEYTTVDPWENEDNWVEEDDPDYPDDEYRYIGPQDYYTVEPRQLLPQDLKEYV